MTRCHFTINSGQSLRPVVKFSFQVKLEYEKPDLCHHELDNIPKTFMKRLKSSGELGE